MVFSDLPKLDHYKARDGEILHYRYYPADSEKVMILLHGISEDSKYLDPLARFVSKENLAQVYSPDLRGYGEKPRKRGDVDYIGQHDDDLYDLIQFVKEKHAGANVFLAGHSAGGGTTIRFAASQYSKEVEAFLLLAPFVHFTAPTTKKSNEDSGLDISISKLIFLMIVNSFRIKLFNHWTIMKLNKPEELRHGTETDRLSYRLFMSRLPKNYKRDLQSLKSSTFVLIGDEDEEFEAKEYEPLFSKYSKAKTKVIQQADHDGILSNEEVFTEVKSWIKQK